MADEFDPAREEARGAFAFVAAELSDDELRIMARELESLAASEAWRFLTGALDEKARVIMGELTTIEPTQIGKSAYARSLAHIQALRWPQYLPDVLAEAARMRDEENKKALERGAAAERS